MPRMYPASVRRQIVSRLRSGEPVAGVAVDTGICGDTQWQKLQSPRLSVTASNSGMCGQALGTKNGLAPGGGGAGVSCGAD